VYNVLIRSIDLAKVKIGITKAVGCTTKIEKTKGMQHQAVPEK
jgi:hypothetical protein